jgi:hypothetical protein
MEQACLLVVLSVPLQSAFVELASELKLQFFDGCDFFGHTVSCTEPLAAFHGRP